MGKKEAEIRFAKILLGDDGIYRVKIFPNAEVKLEDAKEMIAAQEKITLGKKTPVLVDISKVNSITREARDYFSNDEFLIITTACAFITNSPLSKMIGNFFLGLNKPPYPTKLFNSEDRAIAWLKGFVEEEDS